MRRWIKKTLTRKKKTVIEKKKTVPVIDTVSPAEEISAPENSVKMPCDAQKTERVEKMFSRYQGVELMDEFKSIIMELREEKGEK